MKKLSLFILFLSLPFLMGGMPGNLTDREYNKFQEDSEGKTCIRVKLSSDSSISASKASTDTTNFDKNLSSADDTVQKALDTLDDLTTGGGSGYSIYLEEGDVPKLDNSTQDITLDFNGTDFDTSVTGAELDLSLSSAVTKLGQTIDLDSEVSGVLPISKGGTNNSSAYAAGSIIFSNGTTLTQDNAKLYWDDTNNRLGIGTTTPSQNLHIVGNSLITGTSYLENTTKKALSASVASQEIYVDLTNGNDTTGTGSSSAPFKTVQKAVNSLPRVITQPTYINISNGTSTKVSTDGIEILSQLTFRAKNTSGKLLYDNGKATGGSTTTLVDTSKSWTTNVFAGGKIFIYYGTGATQIADITSNTADTITISGTWTAPDSTSYYSIVSSVVFNDTYYPFYFSNLRNVYVYGFQFQDTAAYSIIYTTKASGGVYNCYFNSNRAMCVKTQSDIVANYNYYSIGSYQGIVVEQLSSIEPRKSVFVAESQGTGIGLYVYRSCYLTTGTGTNASYFKNLSTGIYLRGYSLVESLNQNYSGNSSNYSLPIVDLTTINIGGDYLGIGETPSSVLDVNGAIETAVSIKTSDYTVTASDSIVIGNSSSADITFTLPTAVGIAGRRYTFKNINSGDVFIDGYSSQTIDGAPSKLLTTNAALEIVSDGSNWIIVSAYGTIS